MRSWFRGRLVLIATALFVLVGGSSYAAVDITGEDVRNRSLKARDIADNSLGSRQIRSRSLRGADLGTGTIGKRVLRKGLRARLREVVRGAQGPAGPQGPTGPEGPAGERGPAGSPFVDAAAAGSERSVAARFSFGGEERVTVEQNPWSPPPGLCCVVPGSGLVEVDSGLGRNVRLTHYGWGSMIQAEGPHSNMFEFLLGDAGHEGQPILSVRNNGNGRGAALQVRNYADTGSVILDHARALRPSLHVEDNGLFPDTVLAVENAQPNGSIVLATRTGGELRDHIELDAGGRFTAKGDMRLGDDPSDGIVFHGAAGNGRQGSDPGPLPPLDGTAVQTPEQVAAALNEQRRAINALRDAMLAHGLIG